MTTRPITPEPTEGSGPKTEGRGVSSRTAAWLAWSMWTLSVAFIAGAPLFDFLTPPRYPGEDDWALLDVFFVALALVYVTVGALVASRRPENPIGWIFCVTGLIANSFQGFALTYAAYALSVTYVSLPGGEYVAWVSQWVGVPVVALATVLLWLLFPGGRLPSRRWWIVVWIAVLGSVMSAAGEALAPGFLEVVSIENPFGIGGAVGDFAGTVGTVGLILFLASMSLAAVSLIVRLVRAQGEERQQLKWFALAAAMMIGGFSAAFLLSFSPLLNEIGWFVGFLGFMLFPVVVGIAILRHHLYEIDIIINRALVYGSLTAIVVGAYVLVVGGLGALLQPRGNLLVSILVVGLVAVLFQPLRARFQRGVNRLMYGERDEPYKVLSRLGRRLEGTLAPDAALKTIVETIAQALKLPYAAITLAQEGTFVTAAEYGTSSGEPLVLPLTYGPETVGQLILNPRAPEGAFTTSDLRALEDLARQVGVTAYAVRLTADLQRSRERLVTAREEERRRLRRELHDGIGPQLAALTLKLETARNKLANDPVADALLSDLAARARSAVVDVRRSVHALRPPALDELGLVPALRETAAQYDQGSFRISVEAPEDLPPLPAAVEVAAYHIAQEAITNVVRHAEARSCLVRLDLDDEVGLLRLEVEDDGRGIGPERGTGVGLSSMRERAEELGGTCEIESVATGGTRVRVELPCVLESVI